MFRGLRMFHQLVIWVLLAVIFNGCKTTSPTQSVEVGDEASTPVIGDAASDDGGDEVIQTEPAIYRAARSRIWDVIHTKLELSFDWEKQYVNGVATLELRPYFYPQNTLTLDAKGFEILKVGRLSPSGVEDLEYNYDDEVLYIELDKEYTRTEKVHIEIQYVAKPDERVAGVSQAISSDKGLYFIDPLDQDPNKPSQIWTQGETQSNSAWFPTIDSPNERCTQEMYITAAEEYNTLSNGDLVYSRKNGDGTRTDYWKMDQPHAPYLFMLAIGDFAIVEDSWRDIPLQYYVEPEFEPYAKDIFGNTPEMMEFFSQLLNYDYPWSKYAQVVVRDYVSGAMENTTASVFMEDLQLTRRELLDESWDYIIAHELMHQWFGDLVTCESWSNLPLNEGFANYSEYLWNEYKYGKDEAEYNGWLELQNYLAESETKQVPLIRYYYDNREDMFDHHSYAKAGRVLHMLRKYVGDEAFFETLNHYLKSNAYQAVEIDDLRASFEVITGDDLKWFFDQWFLSPGHPVLEVSQEYASDSLHLYIYQRQDTTAAPVYKLPLYLGVYTDDGIDQYPIIIEEAVEKYSFPCPEQPHLVVFDTDRQLVGEVSFQKSADQLHYQFFHAEDFLSRYWAMYDIQETDDDSLKREVLERALSDSSWRIRSEAIDWIVENTFNEEDQFKSNIETLIADPESMVRASALAAITNQYAGYDQMIKSGLADSSYTVAGVALSAYLFDEVEPDSLVIQEFSYTDNINVLIPIAEYYISDTTINRYDWFLNKVQSLERTDLYFFLQYFARYLITAPEDQKLRSISHLEEMALGHPEYYVRLGAFQSLIFMSDLEGVAEKIAAIRESETDPRLIEIYDQF